MVGLGLAITKGLIEIMDGDIGVEAEKGSNFSFTCILQMVGVEKY